MRIDSIFDQNKIIRCTECSGSKLYLNEVKMKLKTSCEYFVRNSKENTMQYDSIDGHNKSVIEYILVNGTIPCSKDDWGETALHITVKGNPDICVVLLTYEEEANVDAFCDKRCMTIYLLKKGADHSLKDHHGKTALHYAAEEGSQDVCQILVSYGADVNCLTSEISDKRYNETPLHLAILYNETCVAKYLLKNGADHSLRDGFGKTALHNAALKGNLDVFKQLVLNGANINCLTSRKKTAISLALHEANYLKKHPNHPMCPSKNCLHSFKKNMAVVEYILENRAVYHPIITRDEYEIILEIFLQDPFFHDARKKIWCLKQVVLNDANINRFTSMKKTAISFALHRAICLKKHPNHPIFPSKNCRHSFKKNMAVFEYILENRAVYHPIITRDEYEIILGIFLQDPFLDEARKKIWFGRLYNFIDFNFFKEPITLKSISRKVIRKHIDLANKLDDVSSFNIPESLKNYLMYENEFRFYMNI
ncbi:hypothetical protein QYM36_010262 [Artemia franciscana]|uniref:SOCS box domain-containing protein n=1 Tax=Artemia franciscana TaxID=6661 RepID=A0AA88I596_ARTSF|nr:hypothetical protein QYM36_010262 [Artemia franciscana]